MYLAIFLAKVAAFSAMLPIALAVLRIISARNASKVMSLLLLATVKFVSIHAQLAVAMVVA